VARTVKRSGSVQKMEDPYTPVHATKDFSRLLEPVPVTMEQQAAFYDAVKEYKDAVEADRAATVRLNESRRALIDLLKSMGLEKLFHL
jgi:hypothetical protein